MISFVKKYSLLLIILTYFILMVVGGTSDGLEFQAVLTSFVFTLVVTIPWLFWQVRSVIRLKNEKKKTELLHLKSQINPHFFFNTLNNLYGLIEKDPKQAGKLVLKLSDMMRYSIYQGQQEVVSLEKEVDYLKDYIELQQMRYHKEIDVKFDVHIGIGYTLTPLLFIILLENAFKHGVENLRSDAFIYLSLATSGDEIIFSIKNNFDSSISSEKGGIGLKNLKRRLELAYHAKHRYTKSINQDEYEVQLIIKRL
ncbi:MAG: sensor histidine kinase [Bacteroidota bacterium]